MNGKMFHGSKLKCPLTLRASSRLGLDKSFQLPVRISYRVLVQDVNIFSYDGSAWEEEKA